MANGRIKYHYQLITILVWRELKSFLNNKSLLLSSLVRPLLWLWIVGAGVSGINNNTLSANYQEYMLPGLLGLSLLFGCIISALGMVQERNSGTMRLIMTAPINRAWIIFSKLVSASAIGIIQAFLLIAVLSPFGYLNAIVNWLGFFFALLLTAFCCSSIGVLLAVKLKNFHSFASVMNFVIFPMFFLSGALYPTQHLPDILKFTVHLNPFAYCVSYLQKTFEIHLSTPLSTWLIIAIILLSSIAFTSIAIKIFVSTKD